MAIDLSSLKKGINPLPPRLAIYGEEKIGKSTFGADAPNPIFLNIEKGQDFINTTRAFGHDEDVTHEKCIELIMSLLEQEHDFKTLVIDSIDWLERMEAEEIAALHNSPTIDDNKNNDLNFGKGWRMVADRVKELLDGFDMLRTKKGMAIIIVGHAQTKTIDDHPIDDKHQHATLKLNKNVEAIVKEWVDCLGFARQKVYITEKQVGPAGKKDAKVVGKALLAGGDTRILCFGKNPAYEGGARIKLPDEMPLNFNEFIKHYEAALTNSTAGNDAGVEAAVTNHQ